MRSGVFPAIIVGLSTLILGACAKSAATSAYNPCPDGQERVKVGPRADVPTYVCRSAP